MTAYTDKAVIDHLLDSAQTWFVVGLGDRPDRPAYGVAATLQRAGKRVVPIHPKAEEVLGEKVYRSLDDAVEAVGLPDVVDCFVNSDAVGDVVRQAIAIGAPAVWLQIGVIDQAAADEASAAGLAVVMDRCPAQELARR